MLGHPGRSFPASASHQDSHLPHFRGPASPGAPVHPGKCPTKESNHTSILPLPGNDQLPSQVVPFTKRLWNFPPGERSPGCRACVVCVLKERQAPRTAGRRRGAAEGQWQVPLTLEQEEAQDGPAQLRFSDAPHVSWVGGRQAASVRRLCP